MGRATILAAAVLLQLVVFAPAQEVPLREPTITLALHVADDAFFDVVGTEAPSPQEGVPVSRRLAALVDPLHRIFASTGLRFRVLPAQKLHLPSPNIAGRSGRDALALAVPQTPGTIDVFVVASVGDVDDPRKEVAGVHWRYLGLSKGNRGRRYIILSANAADSDTLAHELGHWFGLVHVKDPANLMCPGGKRNGQALTRAQVRTISSTCQKSFQTGELKDLPAAAPAHP